MINGVLFIMIDYIVLWIRVLVFGVVFYYVLFVMVIGVIYLFYMKKWNVFIVDICFFILKVVGVVFGILYCLKVGLVWFFVLDIGLFLYEKLVILVSLFVLIGLVFLVLLVGYGLFEFIGIFCCLIMRLLWNMLGRLVIDVVVFFVGSYLFVFFIMNCVYKEGKYMIKEVVIIVIGFFIVFVIFMIIIVKILDIMYLWNVYFWIIFVVIFIVIVIIVRILFFSRKLDIYVIEEGFLEFVYKEKMLECVWEDVLEVLKFVLSIMKNIVVNLKDGFIMIMGILLFIMLVGLIGIVLVKFMLIFDWISYIFYLFIWLL